MSIKKLFARFLLVSVLVFAISGAAVAEQPKLEIDGEGAILLDVSTGDVLFEQDPHVQWKPASVTKVMTLLLALEAVNEGRVDLEDMVVASEYASSFGGSQLYLEPGEKFSLHEMLIGIAVGSGNDASVAVAEHISGSNEAFVDEMNNKVKELGLENTHFVNTHGLDEDEHYTSAYDMAQISRYAVVNYPEILEYTGMKFHVFREEPLLELFNTNKMLWWFEGTDGLKTGFTSAAKRNLASTVERDGLRLLAVVLGVEAKHGHFRESMKLYQYGFSQFAFNKVADKGEELAEIPVGKGEADSVPVIPARDVGFVIKKGADKEVEIELELPNQVTAPIEKGQKVGEIVVIQEGKEMAREDLVASYSIERGSFWRQLLKVGKKVMLK